MKTHELIIAIVLALVLGVLIEFGGHFIVILLSITFGHGMFIFQHYWMLLHRPIQRMVMLFARATGWEGPEAFILYYIICACAWGAIAFAVIWTFHRFYREPDEKE